MQNPRFVYVTYIRTTPEKLWQALIEPEFTRQFWVGTWQDCDWKKGDSWRLMIPDGRCVQKMGRLQLLFSRVARPAVMIQIAALRWRLEKQSTDPRGSPRDLGDGTLACTGIVLDLAFRE
jgi:hypothetical protein